MYWEVCVDYDDSKSPFNTTDIYQTLNKTLNLGATVQSNYIGTKAVEVWGELHV